MTEYDRLLGLQTDEEGRKIVMRIIALLRQEGVTVDCASKILKDAQILIPLYTKLK